MRKLLVAIMAALFAMSGGSALAFPLSSAGDATLVIQGSAASGGPSGSTECHMQDDDCDGAIDEDTGTASDDNDGDGEIDEDSADGVDDDNDGVEGEDPADDDGDGSINEDGVGNATPGNGENQVECGEGGNDVGGVADVYAGPNGAEVCADGGTLPIDGRVVVSADGYVAIDGDNDNPGASNGYLRIDEEGPHCGNDQNQDSGADQSGNSSADCG